MATDLQSAVDDKGEKLNELNEKMRKLDTERKELKKQRKEMEDDLDRCRRHQTVDTVSILTRQVLTLTGVNNCY